MSLSQDSQSPYDSEEEARNAGRKDKKLGVWKKLLCRSSTNLAGAPSVCLPGQPTPIDWLAIALIAPLQERPQNANHSILATGASPNMLGLKHSFSRQIRGFFQPATTGLHVLLFSSADKPSVRMFDNCCAANR